MKRAKFQIAVIGMILTGAPILFGMASAKAQTTAPTAVTINRFKVISGDQYVELKNNTDQPLEMDNFRLVYYNNFNLGDASSSKIISLSGEIPAGGYYLVNDSTQTLCYQSVVAAASLGFATGSGRIELMQLAPTGNVVNPIDFITLDEAGWYRGNNPPDGAVHFPATSQNKVFALRDWQGAEPYKGGGIWLKPNMGAEPCVYELEGQPVQLEDEDFVFLPGTLPPVRRVAGVSESGGKANRNPGKMAPIINEVLPNPASPQSDANDEFVELYNPNDSVFDLSEFKLAFGSTNPRKYTFPEGTVLQPKEFKVFTSGGTSLSLSNTRAQVWLLDPNEKLVGQSDPYESAKDGQAWALDNGKWVWTLQPTPGAINAIALPTPAAAKGKTAAGVLGISSGSSSTGAPAGGSSDAGQLADSAPLHPGVLAAVGLSALAYMAYEYRQDLSNRIFQLRRYLRNRQALRKPVQGG